MTPKKYALYSIWMLLYATSAYAMETKRPKAGNLQVQLADALKKNDISRVRFALLSGATVTPQSKRNKKAQPPFHLAAYRSTAYTLQALFLSPQYGPKKMNPFMQKRVIKPWLAFLCCLNSLAKNNLEFNRPPIEIIRLILADCLPNPEELIHYVPLKSIQAFEPYMNSCYKKRLIAALVQRHIKKHAYALSQKYRPNKKFYTALECARKCKKYASASLLDPKLVEDFKDAIESGYAKLLG